MFAKLEVPKSSALEKEISDAVWQTLNRCRNVDKQLPWGGDDIEASIEIFFIPPESLNRSEAVKKDNSLKKNYVHLEVVGCFHVIAKQFIETIKLGSLPTPSKLGNEGSHRLLNDKKKRKDLGFKSVKEVKVKNTSRKASADNPFLLLNTNLSLSS